ETQVTVTYSHGNKDPVTEVISRQTGNQLEVLSSKTTMPADQIAKPMLISSVEAMAKLDYASMSVSEFVNQITDDALRWVADPSNTFLPLLLWRNAGEAILDVWEEVSPHIDNVVESTAPLGGVIQSALDCALIKYLNECANIAAEETPAFHYEIGRAHV